MSMSEEGEEEVEEEEKEKEEGDDKLRWLTFGENCERRSWSGAPFNRTIVLTPNEWQFIATLRVSQKEKKRRMIY